MTPHVAPSGPCCATYRAQVTRHLLHNPYPSPNPYPYPNPNPDPAVRHIARRCHLLHNQQPTTYIIIPCLFSKTNPLFLPSFLRLSSFHIYKPITNLAQSFKRSTTPWMLSSRKWGRVSTTRTSLPTSPSYRCPTVISSSIHPFVPSMMQWIP